MMEPQRELPLPVEIIYRILCLLSPLDVVSLRLVSREFRDFSHDPSVWRALYENSPLLLPPGPFLSQSTQFLERNLVRSARLERTWTTEPIQKLESKLMRVGASPLLDTPRVIGERWLISCISSKQFVIHDTDSETSTLYSQVLWETEHSISGWDVCTVTSTEDTLRVYVVVSYCDSNLPWNLVEFRLNGNTGQLHEYSSLDVPTRESRAPVIVVSNKSSYLYILGQHLIFGVQSRIFYDFPDFTSELDPDMRSEIPYFVLPTNTHFIALFLRPSTTLVQAFTPPAHPRPTERGTCVLQLTHEGIMQDSIARIFVIKQSSLDPISDTTKLRFLQLQETPTSTRFLCVDFTLPNAPAGNVLPISILEHDLYKLDFDGSSLGHHSGCYLTHSLRGNVRGLLVASIRNGQSSQTRTPLSNTILMVKFTIDATPEECTAVVGNFSPPGNGGIFDLTPSMAISFDGVRGRVYHYTYSKSSGRDPNRVDVAVVDIR